MGSDTRVYTLTDVRRRAMDLLARREHGYTELARKLIHKGLPEAHVHDALEQLSAEGLLSDPRYCESIVNTLYQRGQGPLKIRYKLRSNGISDEVIDQTFAALSLDWTDALQQLYRKKYADRPARTPSEHAKQVRFLSSRGFPQEMIFQFLHGRESD